MKQLVPLLAFLLACDGVSSEPMEPDASGPVARPLKLAEDALKSVDCEEVTRHLLRVRRDSSAVREERIALGGQVVDFRASPRNVRAPGSAGALHAAELE